MEIASPKNLEDGHFERKILSYPRPLATDDRVDTVDNEDNAQTTTQKTQVKEGISQKVDLLAAYLHRLSRSPA